MFRFSVAQLLLLVTIASFTTALLVWRFWFGLVCLALAAGVALGVYGFSRRNSGITRAALCLSLGAAALLAYDTISVAKWVGSCGFEIKVAAVDSQTGELVDGWRAALLHRRELELVQESSSWGTDIDWTNGSAGGVVLWERYGCGGSSSGLGFFNTRTPPPSLAHYFLVVEKPGHARLEKLLSTMLAPGATVHDLGLPLLKVKLARVE